MPDVGMSVEKHRFRNANAVTPMQQRRFRNADAATPPLNATTQKQCAALGFVCPTLRKKSGKQASELASKQPSKRTSELVTEHATGKRTSEQATEHATGKRTSKLATELPTKRTSEQCERACLRCWALRRGIRGGFRRLLRCLLRRLRLVPLRALAGSWSCRTPILRCWRRGQSPERRRRLSFQ